MTDPLLREWVQGLEADVDRVRAERDELRVEVKKLTDGWRTEIVARARLKAELEQLRRINAGQLADLADVAQERDAVRGEVESLRRILRALVAANPLRDVALR